MSNPWDPIEGETAKGYEYFRQYIALPPSERTTVKLAKLVGKGMSNMQKFATDNNWRERALAYDAHCAEKLLEVDQKEREKALKKAYARLVRMLDRAVDRHEEMLDKGADPTRTVLSAIEAVYNRVGLIEHKALDVTPGQSIEEKLRQLEDDDDEYEGDGELEESAPLLPAVE